MSAVTIRARAEQYLAMRRSLGYSLRCQGRLLLNFADWFDASGQEVLTTHAALAWACASRQASPPRWRERLDLVRGFARHLNTLDPTCEIPPADLLTGRRHRHPPYIYTEEEVSALVHAAGTIGAPMQAATVQAVIRLIAASGLRLGEAIGLDRADVALDSDVLTVTGKNSQIRLVPVHPTTTAMLGSYAVRRDRLCPVPRSSAFFLSSTGRRALDHSIQQSFVGLLTQAGIVAPPGRRRPRIHDLRHTFAVATLIDWHRNDVDVRTHLPLLSTYLGHTSPEVTYWYLEGTPLLLAAAAQRLEAHQQRQTATADEAISQ